MGDVKESALTQKSDCKWVRALDANGNSIQISKADLVSVLEGLLPIDGINNRAEDGVFIMFHRKSDDYPLAVKPDKWASYQNSGEIAEGVMIVEGGKILVVAPTEATLYWSSAAVSAGGKTTTDRETALNDWTGKTVIPFCTCIYIPL